MAPKDSERRWLHDLIELYEPDWIVTFPESLKVNFNREELHVGVYTGRVLFRFESLTGTEYRFIYNVRFEITEEGFRITETPSVERELPWD